MRTVAAKRWLDFRSIAVALLGAHIATMTGSAAADEPPAYLVRIPVPIVGNVDERVKREVEQLLGMTDQSSKRPVLVLEFGPRVT